MSNNITNKVGKIVCEIESKTQGVKNKVNTINNTWEGEAQKSFNKSHEETYQSAKKALNKVPSIKSMIKSLENSMQNADRQELLAQRERNKKK